MLLYGNIAVLLNDTPKELHFLDSEFKRGMD